MYKYAITSLALCVAVASSASPGLAQTDTDQFVVSITVDQDCFVSVDNLFFGAVTDLTPEISGATTGTVTCTAIAPVSVSFDPGTGGASTFATRQMESNGETVDYNLYADAAHTEILGDGTGGTVTIDFTSMGDHDPFDIFGLTEANQGPKPRGTYTSIITATLTF
jgi:spore coat protein U-like protein